MIKVNLRGHKQPKSAAKFVSPKNYTPVLLLAVALGFAGYGYWWYSSLTNQVADLDTNLTATGYFKTIDVSNAQDSAGNFVFSLKAEFSPPRTAAAAGQPAAAGGN